MAQEKQKGQSTSSGSEDLISNLPQDIIDLILVRLPIKEMVRTSILSTEWRYKWRSTPDLIFLVKDFPYVYNADEAACLKIINIVDQVLQHHVGPILKFSFFLGSLVKGTTFFRHCNRIDRWIRLLSKNGIESLFLSFFSERYFYDVHYNLFYCQDLRHLDLFGCTLIVPWTFEGLHNLMTLKLESCGLKVPQKGKSFPSLMDLNLKNVRTPSTRGGVYSDIAHLISKCPLLERLTIELHGCGPLEIHAPYLRYLDLNGSYEDLSFGRCPLLADVLLKCSVKTSNNHLMEGGKCNLVRVLGSLHGIQRLEISDLKFFCVGSIPKMLSTPYYHLRGLSMKIDFSDSKQILATLCICRSSPNLHHLKIWSVFSSSNEDVDVNSLFWEVNSLFDHLQFVEMLEIRGKNPELEFIRFLLAKTPLLDTMRIQIDIRSAPIFHLTQFQRASAGAKLIYL